MGHKPCILVTRPLDQAQRLMALIDAQLGQALACPTIEIKPLAPPRIQTPFDLRETDIAIFLSINAVHCYLLPLAARERQRCGLKGDEPIPESFPDTTFITAIGPTTAQALKQHHRVDCIPSTFSSDGLLSDPAFQHIQGKRIAVVCGRDPKKLLFEGLSERGARIACLTVYERQCPARQAIHEHAIQAIRMGRIQTVVTTSRMCLDHFWQLMDETTWHDLKRIPFIVISQAMKHQAKQLGIETILVADNPTDRAIFETLTELISR